MEAQWICFGVIALIFIGVCIGVSTERKHPYSPSNRAKRKAEKQAEEYDQMRRGDKFGRY